MRVREHRNAEIFRVRSNDISEPVKYKTNWNRTVSFNRTKHRRKIKIRDKAY